jgi:molybdopterin-guanine dinucleotide biosynthesis protein A
VIEKAIHEPLPGRERPGLTGLVLCGGRSVRMGADKATLALPGCPGGSTLLERAVAAFEPLVVETVLCCGPTERYGELGLPFALDAFENGGPLAGLEAGRSRSRTEFAAAVACDMPRVDARVFEALLAHALERDLDACFLETVGGVEPLCAVYRRSCLPSMRAALAAGERKATSFARFPDAAGVLPQTGALPEAELPWDLRRLGVACNLNTPADLEAELAAGSAS